MVITPPQFQCFSAQFVGLKMAVSLTAPIHRPAFRFRCCLTSFPELRTSKPTWVSCSNNLSFWGFDPFTGRKRFSGQSKMVNASAFRSGSSSGVGGDEGIRAFEQEAFISCRSYSGFMAGGLESTLNGLSKWLVFILFSAIILWKHDAESLWAATGSVVNAMLSVILKRILNQERPVSTPRSDPGMPSSHAQSIFFMVVYAILSIFEWLGVKWFTLTIGLLVLAMGAYFSWLRVSQQLHTISQVAVGAVLGSAFSGLWYWLWKAFVLEAFNSILWVRIAVIVGAVGFSVGFLLYVIRYWFRDERLLL